MASDTKDEYPLMLQIKWSNNNFDVEIPDPDFSIADLKKQLYELTTVAPEQQKLLNLKYNGKMAGDNVC